MLLHHFHHRLQPPLLLLFILFSVWPPTAQAEEVRVAVAANFLSTLTQLSQKFENETTHTLLISSGSSGKLYAQITHGAPFDVFFSADVKRPQLLEEKGLSVPGSRFTYAVGRLTLWSLDPKRVSDGNPQVLSTPTFAHLAIANPKTAPYGMAAKQTLQNLELWDHVKDRLVQGENIAQTFQFVYSNSAQLGLVALSQVLDPKVQGIGSRWDVPPHLHDALNQQAVLLVAGRHNQAAIAFLDFVRNPTAQKVIKDFGYGLKLPSSEE